MLLALASLRCPAYHSAHTPSLSIKSQAPSATAPAVGAASQKAAYAVLCTPSKTFHLRQVQTSSPLFVTQPALEAHGNAIPAPTTRAVASCTATLELQPSDDSPVPALEQVLPLFDIVDGDVDARGTGKSQAAILPHLPFSDGQCIQAWQELMAFEFAGSSFRPSARALLQVWKSMLAAAVAEGVKQIGRAHV